MGKQGSIEETEQKRASSKFRFEDALLFSMFYLFLYYGTTTEVTSGETGSVVGFTDIIVESITTVGSTGVGVAVGMNNVLVTLGAGVLLGGTGVLVIVGGTFVLVGSTLVLVGGTLVGGALVGGALVLVADGRLVLVGILVLVGDAIEELPLVLIPIGVAVTGSIGTSVGFAPAGG